MRTNLLRAAAVATATTGIGIVAALSSATAAPAAAAGDGTVYVVQGLAGVDAAVRIDGRTVSAKAAGKTVIGPLQLGAGKHEVAVDAPGEADDTKASFTVTRGTSLDVIVHRRNDAKGSPTVTTSTNNLAPTAAGTGRVTVAHDAVVGAADVQVNGKTLFANIGNGEELTLAVPAATYSVQIVPVGKSGPTVLGPVALPIAAGKLTRVIAIGDAAKGTMDAIVQVLPLAGAAAAPPVKVDSGNGGQAQALIRQSQSQQSSTGEFAATAALLGAGVLGGGVLASRRKLRHTRSS
ncbi:DUF4397 domain-containing protein [Flexivirga sp. ID2601S]|uniref:DUF4397 domain-containing protein n=1 Tax=Flexivirga aerilata TaxID=1656889 RepID=A0A849AIV8_9MICO|nr:DUF4397 domain-containing protein [Flexivirga aerilata]NNG38340.1 DUF4397 domain-containing protein [Flexivirga aerilata]